MPVCREKRGKNGAGGGAAGGGRGRARRGAARAGSAPIFEINTGAISRGCRTTPYPAPWILQEIRARGGQVMINSDSHAADTITYAFANAVKLAQDCGFHQVKIITESGFADHSLDPCQSGR